MSKEMQCPKCHDMMHDMGVHYHNGHDRRKWECFNCGYTTYGSHTELGLHRNVKKMKKSLDEEQRLILESYKLAEQLEAYYKEDKILSNYIHNGIDSMESENISQAISSFDAVYQVAKWDDEAEKICGGLISKLEKLSDMLDEDYDASTKKSKMKNRMEGMNIRKENVTEIEVNGEPYYIWESFNGFKGSKENPNQFITNARAVLDFNRNNGFETIQDVIDYINQYFVEKSYNPDYQNFSDMVKSIRNIGNHNNVFKE